MATTFLNISKMKDNRSINEVRVTLYEAGFHSLFVFPGKAKIVGPGLSYAAIATIKRSLQQKGYGLLSISETR